MNGFRPSAASEWKAVLAVALVVGAFVAIGMFRTSGPVSVETASVIRFGSYANELGNHPTVIVRFGDGSTQEVKSDPVLL